MVKQHEVMEARGRERRPERPDLDRRFEDEDEGQRLLARDGRKVGKRKAPRASAADWDGEDDF
jgi:hypothetical protein